MTKTGLVTRKRQGTQRMFIMSTFA